MSNENMYVWLENPETENKIEPWQELDQVIRKWVTLSGWEKDLSDYQKMKQFYQ